MTSIYEQIGGQDALISVVDDFYGRVLADPDLAPFFTGTNLPRLKGRQVEFFAALLGGPDHYGPQTMKDVHRGRGIGQADFDRVAHLLAETLRDAGVPGHLVDQILAALAPLASDIVAPATPVAGGA
ncbi:MAG TPA: group 1 truncated hemoglobin [Amycolatopsis sp.]|nr:group 1 truncated hemoglobin [Amycolatopsis sp.]